jgi:aminopeptidase YwaD
MFTKSWKMSRPCGIRYLLLVLICATLVFSTSWGNSTQLLEEAVSYLASIELKGRRVGTEGNEKAAKYLAKKLNQFGIRPLGRDYRQEFTIFTKMIKNGPNNLQLSGNDESVKFEPLAISKSAQIKNSQLVFAGFGISIPKSNEELVYDDYEGIDVKGKIVAVFSGDPAIGNSSSRFRRPKYMNYRTIFYKLKNAARHGAIALLLISNPLSMEAGQGEPDPAFNPTEGGGDRFEIVAGQVKNSFITSLLSINQYNGIQNTRQLQKLIADTQSPHSFHIGSTKLNLTVNLKKQTGRVANILGYIPGSDENLKRELVVIGGHFDHLGMGGSSSMEPGQRQIIHPGADDNASGTALTLKLARILSNLDHKRSYLIAFFNAEEVGILGSTHLVESWSRYLPTYGKIKAMLNFDMVGRYRDNIDVMAVGSANEWKQYLQEAQNHIISNQDPNEGLSLSFTNSSVGSSDHAPFINQRIPALFFSTGPHEDYHRSTDTADKINFEAMNKLIFYIDSLLDCMDNHPSPTFNPDILDDLNGGGSSRHRFGAHLGCVPRFGGTGAVEGVVCARASGNSPAQRAGIVSGDIIIKLGDIDINNLHDLSFALKFYRPGDKVELVWKRGEDRYIRQVILTKKH